MFRVSCRDEESSRILYSLICCVVFVTLFGTQVQAASASAPSPNDLSAFSVGQSYERSFQDYLQPGTCGIVLERERCRDDFASVHQLAGLRKMDEQVQKWLVDGDLDHRPRDWDSVVIPDAAWQQKPLSSWWYTAGILSIAAQMPRNEGTSNYVASIVESLAKHDSAAPQQFRGLIDSSGSPFDQVNRLVGALDAAIPPAPFPSSSIEEDGDTNYAQLGVLTSTVEELVDNPLALSRPESRLFALAVVDRLEAADRKLGGSFSFDDIRQHLRGDIPSDSREIDVELRQPLVAWAGVFKQAPAQRDAFFLGDMTAQAAYNAAILKDKNADTSYLRGVISQTKPYAGMSTAAKMAVAKMQNVPFGAWTDINITANAATLAIMGQ